MKYLVDANVLSEPTKPTPDSRVVLGFARMSRTSPSIPLFPANCDSGFSFFSREGSEPPRNVAWDAHRRLKWAELLAHLRRTGKAMPIKDTLIAATAAVHDLAVATRNPADFANAGVRIVDPFVG